MKKQYKNPTMVVTELRDNLMLEASLEIGDSGAGGGAGAKGFGFNDDFYDDEEE